MTYWFFLITISIVNYLPKINRYFFLMFMVLMTFFIGWRFNVGGDWGSYIQMFDELSRDSFSDVWNITDVGYAYLNWLVFKTGFNIVFVNFICALIFCIGFYKLSIKFKHFWLPALISFPYSFIAVGMGYTRQAAALGFVFYAFSCLLAKRQGQHFKYFILIILASLMHHTAIVLLMFYPVVLMKKIFNHKFFFAMYGVSIVVVIYLISSMFSENAYVMGDEGGDISSKGALLRYLLHIFPIGIYVINYKKFRFNYPELIQLLNLMLFTVISLFLFVTTNSTLVDRFNVYFIIFDIIVLTKFMDFSSFLNRSVILTILVVQQISFFYIWYFYSPYAICCYRYHNVIENWI